MRRKKLWMNIIDRYIDKMDMTVTTFCQRCKIDPREYFMLKHGRYDVSLNTLLKIAEFTGIPPFVLFLEY